jgi:hypothetical protein
VVKIVEKRLECLEHILQVAKARNVDFVVMTGDLFDDACVDKVTAMRAYEMLSEKSPCPVFVLPGNHDPLLPGSVWDRTLWREAREPVVVLRERKEYDGPGGAKIVAAPLEKALTDPEERVRVCATLALYQIKGTEVMEPIVKWLGSANESVRLQAAWALGKVKDLRAVEPLIKALSDCNEWVSKEAATSLTRIGKPGLNLLKAALEKETDEKIKEELKGIIEKITKQ